VAIPQDAEDVIDEIEAALYGIASSIMQVSE
jgi:hypothetical protein